MKRFYKVVEVAPAGEGFEIHLDGKPILTPGRAVLRVPVQALANAIAEEWEAQKETVEFGIMPITRTLFTALDHVAANRAEVVGQIAKYAETDLVSCRAEKPLKLREFQNNAWQPMVDWLNERFGVRLAVAEGIIPVAQDPVHLDRIRAVIEEIDDIHLAALREITMASGSVVIGLALWDDAIEPEMAWNVAQIEEDFQIGFWGDDPNAIAMREGRRQALMAGVAVFRLLNQ